jgi:CheY-like chemotaxis protein
VIEGRRPSLVILDLALEGGSGLDLLDRVRHADGLASRIDPDLPVIVLSPRVAEADRVRSFARGGRRPRLQAVVSSAGAASRPSSVDLRPGFVEAGERDARVYGRDGGEVEVALVVYGEADRDIWVVFGAVEGDPVIVDRVRPALCAEAAAFQMAVLQRDRDDLRIARLGVAGLVRVLLGEPVPVGAVQARGCRRRPASGLQRDFARAA